MGTFFAVSAEITMSRRLPGTRNSVSERNPQWISFSPA